MHKQNRAAVAIVGYAGVLYAAVAVFAVTLFYSAAIDEHGAYQYPVGHWILASGIAATVAGLLMFVVHALLGDIRPARDRS